MKNAMLLLSILISSFLVLTFMPTKEYIDNVIYLESTKIRDMKTIIPVSNENLVVNTGGGKIVCIDPGHAGPVTALMSGGRSEPVGTTSKFHKNPETGNYWTEYETVLKIGLELRKVLESRGYKVVMTREANTTSSTKPKDVITLGGRVAFSNAAKADAFISIHIDGIDGSPSSRGAHCIYSSNKDKDYAQAIIDAYTSKTGIPKTKTNGLDYRVGNLAVLSPANTALKTLIELGFDTNEQDSAYMNNAANWHTIAEGLADGIDKALGGSKKPESSIGEAISDSFDAIYAAAKKMLGWPYGWGGNSSSGIDCSHFTWRALKEAGVIEWGYQRANEQRGKCTKITKEELRPGDLVFYSNVGGTEANHVAIYIGDNQVIHSGTNGGVQESSISMGKSQPILEYGRPNRK